MPYVPPELLRSKEPAEVKVAYAGIMAVAALGRKAAVAAASASCGLSPKAFREAARRLLDLGWVKDGQDGYAPLLMPDPPKPEEPKAVDIFDAKNRVVDEKAIRAVITAFVKSGINPLLQHQPAMAQAYANPFNRKAALALAEKHGTAAVTKMIDDLARHRAETYCPQPRGLTDLQKKWPNAERFLAQREKAAGVII